MKTTHNVLLLVGASSVPGLAWAMTAAQSAAFRSANTGGGGLTADEVNTFLTGFLAALTVLWFCWVLMSSFKGWAARQTSRTDALSQVLRALFVLIIMMLVIS